MEQIRNKHDTHKKRIHDTLKTKVRDKMNPDRINQKKKHNAYNKHMRGIEEIHITFTKNMNGVYQKQK